MNKMYTDNALSEVWREDLDRRTARPPGASIIDLFAVLSSQRWLIAILFFGTLGAGLFVASRQTEYFYAHALVALGSGQRETIVQDGAPVNDLSRINTEVETLGSTGIMNRIIDLLGPETVATAIGFERPSYFNDIDAPFTASAPHGSARRASSGDASPALAPSSSAPPADRAHALNAPGISFSLADILPIAAAALKPETGMPHSRREHLVRSLQEIVTVRRRSQSDVIEVGFTTPDPEGAVRLSSAIIAAYLGSKEDERRDAAQRAGEWLQKQVKELGEEVSSKEVEITSFQVDNELLSIEGSTIAESQYQSLQAEVGQARADLVSKEALQRQMNRGQQTGVDADALLQIVNSPTVQRLRDRESEIAAQLADAKLRYGEKHPELIANESELAEVRNQITAEIGRVRSGTDNEAEVAQARVRDLEAQLWSLERKVVIGKRANVSLQALERDASTSSAVFQSLMLSAREVAQRETLKVVDARIVSTPIFPTKPSSPPALLWIALFALIGLVVSLTVAVVRSMLRDTIIRPESLGARLGVNSLISVPKLTKSQMKLLDSKDGGPQSYVVSRPFSPFAENFRVLSTYIRSPNRVTGQIIAVTSAEASEGKTSMSLCLARTSTMLGLNVLLVDGDLRRPSLSRIVRERGAATLPLSDELLDGADVKRAIVKDSRTALQILPITPTGPGNDLTVLNPERLCALILSLRDHYDLILIDCPPVLAIAETRLFCSIADGTLLVSRWNATRTAVLQTAKREIERANGQVTGLILNMVRTRMVKSFSYSDVLNFGRGGKGYYESAV